MRNRFSLSVLLVGALLVGAVSVAAQSVSDPYTLRGAEIEAGDGWLSFAERHNVDVFDLLNANRENSIRNPIGWPGQVLILPRDTIPAPTTTTVPDVPATTDPPATTPPVTDPPVTAPPVTDPPATDPPTTEPPATDPPTEPGAAYVHSFDTAASLDDIVFELSDGRPYNDLGQTFQGDHALPDATGSCGNPNTTSRTISAPSGRTSPSPTKFDNDVVRASGVVYWCPNGNNHVMTAYNTKGYAHLDFRPDRTFTDVSEIRWDQNITDMGGKWTEVAVVPLATFNANGQRMDYTNPQRNGDGMPGSWGLKITDGVVKGTYLGRSLVGSIDQGFDKSGANNSITQDRALRTEHSMVDNGNGTITMQRGRADGSVQSHTFPGAFPAGEVVVIWSDVGYNPFKRDGNEGETTWHWDVLSVK